MRQLHRILFAVLVVLVSACGSSGSGGTSSSSNSSSNGTSGGSSADDTAVIPEAVSALLDEQCANRPTPYTYDYHCTIDNKSTHIKYTEVLAEEDTGSSISDPSSLFGENINGRFYVEPSDDGTVYWAARKWALSDSTAAAEEALGGIAIKSANANGEAQVVVDHSTDICEKVRYEVCLVIKAPKGFRHELANSSGALVSMDHEADLFASTSSGALSIVRAGTGITDAAVSSGKLDIVQSGSGAITANSSSGAVMIDAGPSTEEITASASSGEIQIDQEGSGAVTAEASSGAIQVAANASAKINLTTSSGGVEYTLREGVSSLEENSLINTSSGGVDLLLAQGVGLQLDIETGSGSIDVPQGFPEPEENEENSGQSLATSLNNGGATLQVRTTSGSVNIQ